MNTTSCNTAIKICINTTDALCSDSYLQSATRRPFTPYTLSLCGGGCMHACVRVRMCWRLHACVCVCMCACLCACACVYAESDRHSNHTTPTCTETTTDWSYVGVSPRITRSQGVVVERCRRIGRRRRSLGCDGDGDRDGWRDAMRFMRRGVVKCGSRHAPMEKCQLIASQVNAFK